MEQIPEKQTATGKRAREKKLWSALLREEVGPPRSFRCKSLARLLKTANVATSPKE
jgi:hypothetical protein